MTEPSSAHTAVIVLAAGAGTRMKSKTPKILHEIGGHSLVCHALRGAAALEPDHVIAVLGHERDRIAGPIAAIAASIGRPVDTAEQEKQLGTGDAVRAGLTALPDDFIGTVLVTPGDVPLLDGETLAAVLATHRAGTGAAVTLTTFVAADPTGYGRILRTSDGLGVRAIVEERDATYEQRSITEVNAGVYAFDSQTLRSSLSQLSTHNAQGEYYLTDVVEIARAAGRSVRAHTVDDKYLVAGCNDRAQLAELGAELNRRVIRRHQLAGVTVVDPSSTWIDVDVVIGTDVRIEPGTQLQGTTSIDADAVIGPDSTLRNVTVGSGASVIRTHGSDSEIGPDTNVGPFAYLRPGTRLGAGGKIGTFVETKKADIGAGSKVPHLTYVGDATIGEHSNIGASSVFVNYDGVTKHRTVIGSHCRTGSDNMFVAPVQVGDGAYTGAGTVLRDDVPPGALAVSAGQQRNIENWVVRKRPDTESARAALEALDSDHLTHDQPGD
ncbi:bifunctional UDP-N-acetylglucosamine diphosphorylase/glucosamine-1-phosphate N-acetyltransferase GlmU [Gordonia sp. NPDC003424]